MKLLAALLCLVAAVNGVRDYRGYMVVRVRAANEVQLEHLRHLQASDENLEFWTDAWEIGIPVDIVVRSDYYGRLFRSLDSARLNFHIKVPDINKAIEDERRVIEARREMKRGQKAFDLENYHTFEEISEYLNQLAVESQLVTVEPIATTFENRSVLMATISSGNNPSKPVIVMECAVHAREWAAASTCLWFINELATKYGIEDDVTRLVDGFDWKISPVTNPDGYAYTWSTDRLWRKTRRPGNICYGVDLNRNFDVHFGGPGSANSECIDVYHGPEAFSEPESRAIRDVLIANRPRVKAAISIHTYSQLWMSPYGYKKELPADYPEMLRVMGIGVAAIEATYGTNYEFGNHADTIYIASGVTVDHAYDIEGIIYSYLLELRDTGEYAFELPASQIKETAIETWNGIKAMALEILRTTA